MVTCVGGAGDGVGGETVAGVMVVVMVSVVMSVVDGDGGGGGGDQRGKIVHVMNLLR